MSQVEIVQKKSKKSKITWTQTKKFVRGTSKVLLIQVLQSFTTDKMITMLLTIVIAALPVVIPVATRSGLKAEELNQFISRSVIFASAISFAMLSFSNLKDKATLDKNRVAYLNYGKQSIALGKVSGNSLQFFLQILSAYLVLLIIAAAAKADLSGQNAGKIVTYVIGITCYFTFVQTGTRYISASLSKAWVRITILGLWAVLTLGLYLAMSVLVQTTNLDTFYINNRAWMSTVPFVNVTLTDIMVNGVADAKISVGEQIWPVFAMAVESIFFCAVIWKPFSGKLKTYLTT